MTRDDMLTRLRSALDGVTVPSLPPAFVAALEAARRATTGASDAGDGSISRVPAAGDGAASARGDLLARFHDEARAVGTIVHTVADRASAGAILAGIVRGAQATTRALAWTSPLVGDVVAAARRALPGLVVARAGEAGVCPEDAEIGITAVDALVAASGTLVLGAAGARHRGTSLLPRVHVTIATIDQLVPDLAAALRAAGTPDVAGACLTLITGPSRTADIEKKLVLGVHGPCELHVIIVDDAASNEGNGGAHPLPAGATGRAAG